MKLSSTATVLLMTCLSARTSWGFTFVTPSTRTTVVTATSTTPAAAKALTTLLLAASDDDDDDNPIATIRRNAEATFAVIDVDGSGTLSRDELTKHLSVSGYNNETIDKIFNKMDVNNDNEISRSEFQSGMVLLSALQSAPGLGNYNAEFVTEICEDADQVFQSCDADGNGEIDRKELRSHIGRSFADYSEVAIDNIFRQIDADGDGTITQEEWRDAFCKSSALRQAIGEGPNFK
mmetsp:Transcript_52657/g.111852  ORF Transcript_52657/g.111852 Transcript_52657/m.111852 type:complete len:235 (-) Transcript_52657:183-887(-)|eukprot:CAMPEP_0172533086 /NCGR_PEP_ID=MMETSP1067-20121228/5909_1 /TAXON_ID=265564 ORGANISM="Thalassiosira punctigera, Strain Tpunct2005C2" /NCGR_SAMPLE_ID=MMETSP1067 /ASSEMBLY_ACC=CAM_ASM_000444 /LENGTH=234 /DNA_ID=CAMNT_0013317675 /DNA_START=92 /DNA_END=796 /DNA_ORIENTATION=+